MSSNTDIFAGITPNGVSNQRTNGNSISPPLSTTTAILQSPQPKRGKKRKAFPTTPNPRPNKSLRRIAPTAQFFTPQHGRRKVQPQNFSQMPQHLTSEPQQQQSNNSQLNDSNEQLFQQQQRQKLLKLQSRLDSIQAQHVSNQSPQIQGQGQPTATIVSICETEQERVLAAVGESGFHSIVDNHYSTFDNSTKALLSQTFIVHDTATGIGNQTDTIRGGSLQLAQYQINNLVELYGRDNVKSFEEMCNEIYIPNVYQNMRRINYLKQKARVHFSINSSIPTFTQEQNQAFQNGLQVCFNIFLYFFYS